MGNETSRSEADKDDADCKIYLPMKDEQDVAPKYDVEHDNCIALMAMKNWWDPNKYVALKRDKLREMLKPNTRGSDVARKYDDPTFIMMKNGENVGKVI
ncbi:unnamed protein product [Camellia sinensis]